MNIDTVFSYRCATCACIKQAWLVYTTVQLLVCVLGSTVEMDTVLQLVALLFCCLSGGLGPQGKSTRTRLNRRGWGCLFLSNAHQQCGDGETPSFAALFNWLFAYFSHSHQFHLDRSFVIRLPTPSPSPTTRSR